MDWHTAYIGLGSNVGDRHDNLTRAVDLLIRTPGIRLLDLSHLIETAPVGVPDAADGTPPGEFLNGVLAVRTTLAPTDLLDRCRSVEANLGRPPADRRERNASRTLDLDLLLYDDRVIDDPVAGLRVPHPRLHERAFVLTPLAELAPDLVHPELGRTMEDLRREATGESLDPRE